MTPGNNPQVSLNKVHKRLSHQTFASPAQNMSSEWREEN